MTTLLNDDGEPDQIKTEYAAMLCEAWQLPEGSEKAIHDTVGDPTTMSDYEYSQRVIETALVIYEGRYEPQSGRWEVQSGRDETEAQDAKTSTDSEERFGSKTTG